jgi:uncharacterized RDD family membrane protein YckC
MQQEVGTTVHPGDLALRRFLARTGELILFGALLDLLTPIQVMQPVNAMLLVLAQVPLDCIQIGLFGTTLGKFLLGMKVVGAESRDLTLRMVLKRSFLVWVVGQACGFGLLMPFSAGISYGRLKEKGATIWDEWAGTAVISARREVQT